MFRLFLQKLPQHAAATLRIRYLIWHMVAILLTYALVISGFDWHYFEITRGSIFQELSLPAAIIGFFVPIVVPVSLYMLAEIHRNKALENTAAALAQAGIIAWCVSSLYKAFTGRIQPEFLTNTSTIDISHDFNFGFFNHGIFWGWPSSHTAVAFAMSVAFFILYPKLKIRGYAALLYALYIGIGVSISIHWFSDFLAGAIMGTVIGIAVGRSFIVQR
jgi:membrane-associated phospholipid phosphatase